MGHGIMDYQIFCYWRRLAQHTERDSFNARLIVSAGQEAPPPPTISLFPNFFFAFARKSAYLVTCCSVLPHSFPPFFLPSYFSVLSFVFVKLLRANPCGLL